MPEYNDGSGHIFAHQSTITFRCANCAKLVTGATSCLQGTPESIRFCEDCAGIAEALAIGARQPVFLYESDKPGPIPGCNAVTNWGSAVLGYVIGKTVPFWNRGPKARKRTFCPVRFRVKMLDGSLWYGFGPTSNGNYIRLRPMAAYKEP